MTKSPVNPATERTPLLQAHDFRPGCDLGGDRIDKVSETFKRHLGVEMGGRHLTRLNFVLELHIIVNEGHGGELVWRQRDLTLPPMPLAPRPPVLRCARGATTAVCL